MVNIFKFKYLLNKTGINRITLKSVIEKCYWKVLFYEQMRSSTTFVWSIVLQERLPLMNNEQDLETMNENLHRVQVKIFL